MKLSKFGRKPNISIERMNTVLRVKYSMNQILNVMGLFFKYFSNGQHSREKIGRARVFVERKRFIVSMCTSMHARFAVMHGNKIDKGNVLFYFLMFLKMRNNISQLKNFADNAALKDLNRSNLGNEQYDKKIFHSCFTIMVW